jgi:pimeloyl-ACP methyl ester carboxylesterase
VTLQRALLAVILLALLAGLVPGFTFRASLAFKLMSMHGVGEALALCGGRRIFRAALGRCFHAPVASEVNYLVDHDYAERTGIDARAAYLATVRGLRNDLTDHATNYRRALATLDVPLLLIHGRHDPAVRAAHCAEVADSLPRTAVRWLDACGHFPQIEHPSAVNAWLVEFLVGRPAPR